MLTYLSCGHNQHIFCCPDSSSELPGKAKAGGEATRESLPRLDFPPQKMTSRKAGFPRDVTSTAVEGKMERCGSVEGGDSAVEIANSSDATWSDYTTMYRRNGLSRSCQCGEKSSRSKETKRTKLVKLVANGRSKISIHQAALPLPAAASPVLRSSNKGSPHQVSEGKTRLSRADRSGSLSQIFSSKPCLVRTAKIKPFRDNTRWNTQLNMTKKMSRDCHSECL